MNINDYQRPKSKSTFKLTKNLVEQKQREIKYSLQKEIFLSKKQNFNKSKQEFINRHHQVSRVESKETKENKFITSRPRTHKYSDSNNINFKSFKSQSIEKNYNNIKATKSFNNSNNIKIYLNNKKKEEKKDEKNKEDIFPKLSEKIKFQKPDKITYFIRNHKNSDTTKNKTKTNFFSFRNNIKMIERKTDNSEEKDIKKISNNINLFKLNNLNTTKNFAYYKKYKYIIRPENCGYLIKNCFKHRINWIELTDLYQKDFNFKWQQNTKNLDFTSLSKIGHFKQMVNHYEYHSVITNKANLFLNLMKHAEMEEENVFKYLPFTLLFEYGSDNFFLMMDNFEKVFNNIDDYLVPFDEMDSTKFKYNKNRIYYNLFPYEDHLGTKTAINIPNTHVYLDCAIIQEKNKKNENEKNNNDKIMRSLWLVKAPDLNRGMCIQVVDNINIIKKHIINYYRGIDRRYNKGDNNKIKLNKLSSIEDSNNCNILGNSSTLNQNGHELTEKTYHRYRSTLIVVQKYIEKPLLYFGRKFDIRIWVLLTHDFKVYMFNEGHLKCCSVKYDLNIDDNFSHLTNYSFQKYNNNFGRYEKGNEVSFDDLQYNIEVNYNNCINFKTDVIPKIKNIIKFVFQSVKNKINGLNRNYTFEIYGFDFMLDIDFNPFLIEVNLNPGLEESSPLIKMIIPRMLDDALRLTVDKEFNTVYLFKGVERRSFENNYNYESPFPVNGYTNSENLFSFICDLNIEEGTNKKLTKFRHLRIKTKKTNISDKFL